MAKITDEAMKKARMYIPKEFNLSERRRTGGLLWTYHEKDVKEFIKREWFLIAELMEGIITPEEFVKKRDALAGDKL